jgi:hypothetical protein
MSATPAAALARLRAVYGHLWRVDRDENLPRYTAVRRDGEQRVVAATLAELEELLAEAGWL